MLDLSRIDLVTKEDEQIRQQCLAREDYNRTMKGIDNNFATLKIFDKLKIRSKISLSILLLSDASANICLISFLAISTPYPIQTGYSTFKYT